MKTIIPSVLLLIFLFLTGVSANVQAVLPATGRCLFPGSTRLKGKNALFNLTTGSANTAVGWYSLFGDTESSLNTATGAGALLFNTIDSDAGSY